METHPLLLAIEEIKKMPTIDIKGKAYSQVSTRIAVFRKYFPNASIVTKILHDDEQKVVVQATISLEGTILSTGLSEEFRNDGFINSTSALENSETSAIGRALAGLSLFAENGEYASSNEIVNAVSQQQKQITNNQHYQQQSPQHQYQHSQDFTAILNAGLQVLDNGNGLLTVSGDGIFEKKNIIKNSGFRWDGQNRQWYMQKRQAA